MPPLTGKLTFTSATPPDLATCTRAEVRAYFENTYDLDESLFSGIADEAFYTCPDRLRLPLIFYYVHPAAVYVNKLMLAKLLQNRPKPHFEALFETGVDEMSWDDTENYRMGGAFVWPSLQEAFEYRKKVRKIIINIIETAPLSLPITESNPWWVLFLGFEHERIHLETSSVLIRQLPLRLVNQPKDWTIAPLNGPSVAVNELVSVKGSTVTLGKPENFPSFGWDNEYGKAVIDVPDFTVSKFVITNREMLEFVNAGGYQDQSLWSEEGWRWVQFREARHPTFWVCDKGCKNGCGSKLAGESHCVPVKASGEPSAKQAKLDGVYRYRTVFSVIDMPWDWPVDVNYLEAKAYCAWKSRNDGVVYRLPTEAEYSLLRNPVAQDLALSLQSEVIYQKPAQANINMVFHSSTPVNFYPPTKAGVYDAQGNVWQWVEDHFNGLPGFKSHYIYDDFSSPCFDSRHTMIMAGSFISTGDEASRFARFAFRRHFFQHCGFRLVVSTNPTPVRLTVMPDEQPLVAHIPGASPANVVPSTNIQLHLESQQFLLQMLDQDYGASSNATLQLSGILSSLIQQAPTSRALVIGSATGRIPLDMSQQVPEILAIDYWGKGVEVGNKLVRGGQYDSPDGSVIPLPAGSQPDRVTFKQLTWLPQEVGEFDVCVFNRFFERALNPDAWFPRMREVCRKGGKVVVASSSWTAERLQQKWGAYLQLASTETIASDAAEPVTVTTWTKH